MPYYNNDGIRIYYEVEGEGPPVILIHGFALNMDTNWKSPKWVKHLKDSYKLILFDCRGHGKSDKPYLESDYGQKMNNDVVKLMNYLSIEKANFFGYSNGAMIIFELLLSKPEIFISAILGGFVLPLINNEEERVKYTELNKKVVESFKAESSEQINDPSYRLYRQITEKSGNDLIALAAVVSGNIKRLYNPITSLTEMKKALKKIKIPVMTVLGSNDISPGDKTLAAQLIPNACHFQIQGKDHLTVVHDPKFHMIVKAYLNFINQ